MYKCKKSGGGGGTKPSLAPLVPTPMENTSCIIFCKKLFKSQKMIDTNLKCYRFPPFSQIL